MGQAAPKVISPQRSSAQLRSAFADLVHRTLYRAGYKLARQWWRLRRPRHVGALVAVRALPDRLLVVRLSYRDYWTLPGGGVQRGETPRVAAARELGEELGLHVDPQHLLPAIEMTGAWDFRQDRVHVFELHPAQEPLPRPDRREVVEARFVDRTALPHLRLSPPLAAYIAALATGTASMRGLARREQVALPPVTPNADSAAPET
jgi:8-oxo-dGTP diphosphatase